MQSSIFLSPFAASASYCRFCLSLGTRGSWERMHCTTVIWVKWNNSFVKILRVVYEITGYERRTDVGLHSISRAGLFISILIDAYTQHERGLVRWKLKFYFVLQGIVSGSHLAGGNLLLRNCDRWGGVGIFNLYHRKFCDWG